MLLKKKTKIILKKNINSINEFLTQLYSQVDYSIKNKKFPLTLGGDHSIAIASVLSSLKNNDDLGVIWIDAHADFNTFETTETGNIHGLPLAAVCGLCPELTNHLQEKFINPKKCVIVGARSIDKEEANNLKKYGVTFFSTQELKKDGINKIMDKAFKIAGNKVHISYDLDIIDPQIAKGVSVPEKNGINEIEAKEIIKYLKTKIELIKSFDLVEYNPTFDNDKQTLYLANKLLNLFINN